MEKSGQFQAHFTDLSIQHGKVRINVEQSIIGNVLILMGGLKSFEPYMLNYENCTLELPNGKLLFYYRNLGRGVLPENLRRGPYAVVDELVLESSPINIPSLFAHLLNP